MIPLLQQSALWYYALKCHYTHLKETLDINRNELNYSTYLYQPRNQCQCFWALINSFNPTFKDIAKLGSLSASINIWYWERREGKNYSPLHTQTASCKQERVGRQSPAQVFLMKMYLWNNPMRGWQENTGKHLSIHSSFGPHMIQTEVAASYKLKADVPKSVMPWHCANNIVVGQSEAALTVAGEKTPAKEQKPVESEWLSVSRQDTEAVRTADKHTYSCTQISSLSCEHLLNCSPHSSVSYYLIRLSKCSL